MAPDCGAGQRGGLHGDSEESTKEDSSKQGIHESGGKEGSRQEGDEEGIREEGGVHAQAHCVTGMLPPVVMRKPGSKSDLQPLAVLDMD